MKKCHGMTLKFSHIALTSEVPTPATKKNFLLKKYEYCLIASVLLVISDS
jgi:hypothetical protein